MELVALGIARESIRHPAVWLFVEGDSALASPVETQDVFPGLLGEGRSLFRGHGDTQHEHRRSRQIVELRECGKE